MNVDFQPEPGQAQAAQAPTENPLAVIKPARRERLWTLGEFLKKEAIAERKHFYENGKITPMPFSKGPHNLIASNFMYEIRKAIDKHEKNLLVIGSDQMIYFPEENAAAYPDALVVCERLEYHDGNQSLLINPLLVVEVLLPSTRRHDRTTKFDLYKTLPSFREYILAEQDQVRVESRLMVEPNLWREKVETAPGADFWLESLGFSINLKDIYKRVPGLG